MVKILPIKIRNNPGKKYAEISPSKAMKAIEAVKNILNLLFIGPPIIHRDPAGETHIDLPLMYNGVALDRIHYDPLTNTFSPKGRPVHVRVSKINEEYIKENADKMLKEVRVINAAEYREPENCWVIPLAWKTYIIAHVKIDVEGEELIPDYGLTAEIGGRIAK